MTKTFSKAIADNIGYVAATEISAIASDSLADIDLMNRMRKAEGRPTIEEEEAENKAFLRECIAEGFELDPDVVAYALSDD